MESEGMAQIKAVISDMDGVLWRGDMALPGLSEFFALLEARGWPFVLATNNSSKTQLDYVNKLAGMGVAGVPEQAIVTSGTATMAYLQKHYAPGSAMHVFGGPGLFANVEQAGFRLSNDGDVQAVIAGLNREMSYQTLWQATTLILKGADFIGTNPDTTYPTPDGLAPGAGSMLAALQAASGVEPLIIGKPHPPMFETALALLGSAPNETLMIGDRLETDIVGAQRLGIQTALVLSGVSTAAEAAESAIQPDFVAEDMPSLLQQLSSR